MTAFRQQKNRAAPKSINANLDAVRFLLFSYNYYELSFSNKLYQASHFSRCMLYVFLYNRVSPPSFSDRIFRVPQ